MDTNQQIQGLLKIAEQWAKPARVLFVDDDSSLRAMYRAEQRFWAVEFIEAANGPEALDCLSRYDDITLAWIDLRLPGMSGMDVFRAVRRMPQFIPVVIMSGYINDEVLHQCRSIGFASYVQKPDDFSSKIFAEVFQTFGIKRRENPQPQEK